jgi:hypothetical protein
MYLAYYAQAKGMSREIRIRAPQLNSLRLSSSKNLTGQAEVGNQRAEVEGQGSRFQVKCKKHMKSMKSPFLPPQRSVWF